jgi:hypothetical protein
MRYGAIFVRGILERVLDRSVFFLYGAELF